jgi:hypothetical protein
MTNLVSMPARLRAAAIVSRIKRSKSPLSNPGDVSWDGLVA